MAKTATARRLSVYRVPHTRIEDEENVDQFYSLGAVLGKGTYGTVYRAVKVGSNEVRAIKIVPKEKVGTAALKLVEREVALLKIVEHDHIIQLHEVFETDAKMYLVMELCEQGPLSSFLESQPNGYVNEESAKLIIQRVGMAISYLHKLDIVHRDLKLDNILLQTNPTDPADPFFVKVTDFGLSVMKDGVGTENMLQSFCGTPVYMAPEIVNNRYYSQQCDNWAVGIILYKLLSGHYPWVATKEDKLFESINNSTVEFKQPAWSSVSAEMKGCVKGLLQKDPAQRLTAGELVGRLSSQGHDGYQGMDVLTMMKEFSQSCKLDDEEEEKRAEEKDVTRIRQDRVASVSGLREDTSSRLAAPTQHRPVSDPPPSGSETSRNSSSRAMNVAVSATSLSVKKSSTARCPVRKRLSEGNKKTS